MQSSVSDARHGSARSLLFEAQSASVVDSLDVSTRSSETSGTPKSFRRKANGNSATASMDSLDLSLRSPESTTKLRKAGGNSVGVEGRIARQTENNATGNKIVEALTINKLRFDKVGMVGRAKEQDEFLSSFDRLMIETKSENPESISKKQVVFISGFSGVGKSRLVKSLYQHSSSLKVAEKPILMGHGKYDFNDWDEPFAGVVTAFEDVFRQIGNSQVSTESEAKTPDVPLSLSKIGSRLMDELGPTAEILVRLMPLLKDILSLSESTTSTTEELASESDFNFEASQKQLKYAFRVLTRVLCDHCRALILVLDDLQWADIASLDIFDYLLSDIQNKNAFMIVGCYRPNEVDENHILKERISLLEGKQKIQNFEITSITLESLSLECTNEVIMRLLLIDDPKKTMELAELCFKRTMGNPHFLIEFVTMLKDEDLLEFNLGLLQWRWDVNKIEDLTMSTDNVAALLQSRMKKLSLAEQLVLQYAACLGSSFLTKILNLVWTKHSSNTHDKSSFPNVDSLLIGLEQKQYIEPYDNEKYRWVHDKVQEAALSLGNAQESSFQFEIGTILYNTLEAQDLDDAIFDVVDLINRGNVKRRPELAALNLRAAEKARRISAFTSASSYVAHGIDLLPNDKWKTHRDMTLRLHTLGTQQALAIGNMTMMEDFRRKVLAQEDCTTIEKIPIQVAHIKRLCLESEYDEAIEFSLGLLTELGCNLIPRRSLLRLQAIVSLKRTIRKAKKISPRAFCQSQPVMKDPRRSAIIEILGRLCYAAFLGSNTFVVAISATRAIQYTMKYGINQMSGWAFASLAAITKSVFKDFATASIFADTARFLANRFQEGYQTAAINLAAYLYVLSWTDFLSSVCKPMLETYKIGVRAGNNDHAGWCLLSGIFVSYQLGKPLPSILARSPECLYEVEEMGLSDHAFFMRLHWQTMLKMTGEGKDPTVLEGEIFDGNMDDRNLPFRIGLVNKARLELFLFYGEYENAAKLAIQCGDKFEKANNGGYMLMAESFHRCLALYAGYRITKERKYKKEAVRIRKKIATWVRKGCLNLAYQLALLNAEHAAMNKKFKEAEILFKQSIVLAARPGHLHHAALFNERYADFLMQDDPYFAVATDDAEFHLGEAIRYYKEWGANRKVELLQNAFAA